MNFKKYKWPFYIFTFLLITIVSAAMKNPNDGVPPISSAILLVGLVYGIIFVFYKVITLLFKPRKNKHDQSPNEDISIEEMQPQEKTHQHKSRGFNLFKILIISIVGLMTLGSFYWFYWRPEEIRKVCAKKASERGKKADSVPVANNAYRYCLAENGLKPESLFVESD